jgi:Bacterial virulence protein (VirJ)
MMPRRAPLVASVVAVAFGLSACATHLPLLVPNAPVQMSVFVPFPDGDELELHLSRPCTLEPNRPLVVYSTGDGGWRGKDRDAFERMVGWGYPLAGFSAPKYLRHLVRHTNETTPRDVARDYRRIIKASKERLGIPENAPTVLVGVSRGAGLAVAAAGEPELQPLLGGVVAVALTREEEYVHRLKRPKKQPHADPELVMLDNYDYLPRLRSLPLSIIQSTHDDYLPAEEARRLLGPDSALRQLHPIESRNHSFADAREPLYQQMQSALAWVCHFLPSASVEHQPPIADPGAGDRIGSTAEVAP